MKLDRLLKIFAILTCVICGWSGVAAHAQGGFFAFDVDRQAALRSLGKIFVSDLAVGEAGTIAPTPSAFVCLNGDRSISIDPDAELVSSVSEWTPVTQWRVQRLAQNGVSLTLVALPERSRTVAQHRDGVRDAVAFLISTLVPCDSPQRRSGASSQWLRVQSINGARQASQLLMQLR